MNKTTESINYIEATYGGGMVGKDWPDAVVAAGPNAVASLMKVAEESFEAKPHKAWAWLRADLSEAEALAWLGDDTDPANPPEEEEDQDNPPSWEVTYGNAFWGFSDYDEASGFFGEMVATASTDPDVRSGHNVDLVEVRNEERTELDAWEK